MWLARARRSRAWRQPSPSARRPCCRERAWSAATGWPRNRRDGAGGVTRFVAGASRWRRALSMSGGCSPHGASAGGNEMSDNSSKRDGTAQTEPDAIEIPRSDRSVSGSGRMSTRAIPSSQCRSSAGTSPATGTRRARVSRWAVGFSRCSPTPYAGSGANAATKRSLRVNNSARKRTRARTPHTADLSPTRAVPLTAPRSTRRTRRPTGRRTISERPGPPVGSSPCSWSRKRQSGRRRIARVARWRIGCTRSRARTGYRTGCTDCTCSLR